MRRLVLMVVIGCLLASCGVLGRRRQDHPLDPDKVTQIEKGMDREQVTDLLGAPQEIVFSNKEHDPLREHAYIYEYKDTAYTGIIFGFINFGNMDEKRDRVIVFFDEDGTVEHVGASLHADEASFDFPFGS